MKKETNYKLWQSSIEQLTLEEGNELLKRKKKRREERKEKKKN